MKLARRVMDGFEINFEHFTEIDKRQYRNLNTTKCKSMTTWIFVLDICEIIFKRNPQWPYRNDIKHNLIQKPHQLED